MISIIFLYDIKLTIFGKVGVERERLWKFPNKKEDGRLDIIKLNKKFQERINL